MKSVIDNFKTYIGNLSNELIEIYHTEKYQRFYKGPSDKVSLATACFYIGQGMAYITKGVEWIRDLRTALLNRFK